MYAYIKGTLEEKSTDSIVVETAGIGYKIYVSEHTMAKLGENEDVRVEVLAKICVTLGCKLDDIVKIES